MLTNSDIYVRVRASSFWFGLTKVPCLSVAIIYIEDS